MKGKKIPNQIMRFSILQEKEGKIKKRNNEDASGQDIIPIPHPDKDNPPQNKRRQGPQTKDVS